MIAIACLRWIPKLHADHDLFHIMACSTSRHDETIALEALHEMQEPQVKQQSFFYIESVEPQLAQQQLPWHSHMTSAALPCILQSVTCSKSWKMLIESIDLGKIELCINTKAHAQHLGTECQCHSPFKGVSCTQADMCKSWRNTAMQQKAMITRQHQSLFRALEQQARCNEVSKIVQ